MGVRVRYKIDPTTISDTNCTHKNVILLNATNCSPYCTVWNYLPPHGTTAYEPGVKVSNGSLDQTDAPPFRPRVGWIPIHFTLGPDRSP